jgi:hypothetical protein
MLKYLFSMQAYARPPLCKEGLQAIPEPTQRLPMGFLFSSSDRNLACRPVNDCHLS